LVQAIHTALISPRLQRGEQFDRGLAGLRGHRRHAPQAGDFGAVFGVGEVAMRRKQVGQAADFAAAHRVRLAGQREGAGSRACRSAGGQMQVDQRGVVVRAVRRLVESLAVQRQRRRRLPNQRAA
jgi:hypothetical protein